MIPREIHQYWDPCATLPDRIRARMVHWHKRNPEFLHRVWTSKTAAAFVGSHFGQHARRCFEACPDAGLRVQFFSAAVLLARGGFVVEPTQICLQGIAPLADLENDVVLVPPDNKRATIGMPAFVIMGARRGATLIGRAFAAMLTGLATGDAGIRALSELLRLAGGSGFGASRPRHLTPEQAGQYTKTGQALLEIWSSAHCSGAPGNTGQGKDIEKQAPCPNGAKFGAALWTPMMFVGHPRCGSKSLAAGLRAAGLRVGYEGYGEDGVVSWFHTGWRLPHAKQPVFSNAVGKDLPAEFWLSARVLHYIRDPREAIPSIVLENEAMDRTNNSFTYRRIRLKQRFGIDIGLLDPPAAAATSYALWNGLAEEAATDGLIFIEHPDLQRVIEGRDLPQLPHINTSRHLFGKDKPQIDVTAAVAASPEEAKPYLKKYFALYEASIGC